MVNSLRVECTSPSNQSMNFIIFRKQQFGQVRAVLSGNSSDKSYFTGHGSTLVVLGFKPVNGFTNSFFKSDGGCPIELFKAGDI